MPRTSYRLDLTDPEREELQNIVSKGSHRSQKVLNALILLNSDEKGSDLRPEDQVIAQVLQTTTMKIHRVKKRFIEGGLEVALHGKKREREYERKADGDFEAKLVALSCGDPPEGFSTWSLRLLADQMVELGYVESISHETVRRVLKKTRLNRGGASAG